jgi:hypothetical protein
MNNVSAFFTGHLALLVESELVQGLRAMSSNQETKPLKLNARGTWLKSTTLATLSIQAIPSTVSCTTGCSSIRLV